MARRVKCPNLEDQVPDIVNEDQEVKTAVSTTAVKIEGDIYQIW